MVTALPAVVMVVVMVVVSRVQKKPAEGGNFGSIWKTGISSALITSVMVVVVVLVIST